MKEVCSLRRGWAGSSASLSSPARNIVELHNARLDKCPLRAHSVALRIRARITRPGSTSRTRDHASGRPHPVPLANVDEALVGSIRAVCADPLPAKSLGVHGWSMTRDHHAGMGADQSRDGPL